MDYYILMIPIDQLVTHLFSRSPQTDAIPIVDNAIRAISGITTHARELSDASSEELGTVVENFDREKALAEAERAIREGGNS